MRQRRGASPAQRQVETTQREELGAVAESLLKNRVAKDFLARSAFVGIFIVENVLHAVHFDFEVQHMVVPAVAPLPYEFAVSLHLVHIIFGLFGALFVLVSGFDTAGRTALTKGTAMMLVFMATITWTWWINRQGTPYWHLDAYWFWDLRCSAEKRNRTVQILKNISISGALTILQQLAKYETESLRGRVSFLEGLITALRPWTFPAVLGPHLVLLATLRCVLHQALPGYTAVFSLILALMAIQAASNLVNSYVDFKKGLDQVETAGDRTLVDQLVSMRTLQALILLCLSFWASFFVWSVWATNFSSTVLGWAIFGTTLAIGYTAGPAPLKYLGLGDLTVLICFGPGITAYSIAVLIGPLPWPQLACAMLLPLPAAFYVVAILHANNYRDIEVDKQAGATTMAILLGREGSLRYYKLLLCSAHLMALLFGWMYQSYGTLATIWVIPRSWWLCRRIHDKRLLRDQDEETAKTMMMFSVSLALGLVVMPETVALLPMGISLLVVLVLQVFAD